MRMKKDKKQQQASKLVRKNSVLKIQDKLKQKLDVR